MAGQAKARPGTMTVDVYPAGLDLQRRAQAERLIDVFSDTTGLGPVIWAGSMVGFGR